MKILRFYILYRLPIILLLAILGGLSHYYKDPITAWICYSLAFISLLLYFMMGTMRLVQEAVSEGEVDKAMEYIKMIKFPRLLLNLMTFIRQMKNRFFLAIIGWKLKILV